MRPLRRSETTHGYVRRAEKVGALVAEVKGAPLAQGFDEVFYPGELEDRSEQRQRSAGGIALPMQTWKGLSELAGRVGVSVPEV